MRRRPRGTITRGTTAPNRLRRVDRWIAASYGSLVRHAADPLVADLGFGRSPVTTVELAYRLRTLRPDVRVVGVEIDPARVADAIAASGPAGDHDGVSFDVGGFELAGLRPVLVRAMNVLRQYDEDDVGPAWAAMTGALAPGGVVIEGTCDETGRLASWFALDAGGPRTFTLAARLASLERPSDLAARLPKALIGRNVAGEPVHELLAALDRAWSAAAPYGAFGPRQRWVRTVLALAADGWPVEGRPARWRLGELTLRWPLAR